MFQTTNQMGSNGIFGFNHWWLDANQRESLRFTGILPWFPAVMAGSINETNGEITGENSMGLYINHYDGVTG